jgi:hypothetical protein
MRRRNRGPRRSAIAEARAISEVKDDHAEVLDAAGPSEQVRINAARGASAGSPIPTSTTVPIATAPSTASGGQLLRDKDSDLGPKLFLENREPTRARMNKMCEKPHPIRHLRGA